MYSLNDSSIIFATNHFMMFYRKNSITIDSKYDFK